MGGQGLVRLWKARRGFISGVLEPGWIQERAASSPGVGIPDAAQILEKKRVRQKKITIIFA